MQWWSWPLLPWWDYIYPSIRPLSILLIQSQLTPGERRSTPWAHCQSVIGLTQRQTAVTTHIHTYEQLRIASWYILYVFGLWEETRVPRGNPHRHRKHKYSEQKGPGQTPRFSELLWGKSILQPITLRQKCPSATHQPIRDGPHNTTMVGCLWFLKLPNSTFPCPCGGIIYGPSLVP